jgi:bacterial leucyl aminopeptidase
MTRPRTFLFALALAGCASVEPAAPIDPMPGEPMPGEGVEEAGMRWISIDADALDTAQMALDERGAGRVLTPVEVVGDVAVLAFDAQDFRALSELMHVRHNRCGGFAVHESLDDAQHALRSKGYEPMVAEAVTYTLDNAATVEGLLPELQETRIVTFINSLSSFQNRYYTSSFGVQSSDFIFTQWSSIAASRTDIVVERFPHAFAQKSIILTIPGSIPGSPLANEVVIVGGHQDSIAPGGATSVAPGADDDASGIATITEVLRALVAKDYRPQRTVKFMAYAAEEVGLRGSADIATDYQARGVNVVGVVQFDMTNYKGSDKDIWLIQDFTNAAQNTFLQTLIDTYVGASWGIATCGYACSDHASWTRKGFPASMPFESTLSEYNPTIHTSGDKIEVSGSNAMHAVKFARLGVAFIAELAKGTLGAPPVNTPPMISILSPTAGATVAQQVTLAGTASDAEDGDLGAIVTWSSNLDGALGTGASVATTLSPGAQVVTASATDAAGAITTATVAFTVAAPVVDLFRDDFEGPLSWSSTGLWHSVTSSRCAAPGYSSPVRAMYFGQDTTCTYAGNGRSTGTLTSAVIPGVLATSSLRFKYYRVVERAAGTFDVASVEVLSDLTSSLVWSRSSSNPSQTTWLDSGAISLAAFTGQSVRIRFRFDTRDSVANGFTGWLIDDVVVTR